MDSTARRVAIAGMIGSAVEWYDFYLCGTAAALVFNQLFYSQLPAAAAVVASFGTYAVGFVARPLGAAVAGHLGDRVGRKPVLVVTLFLMGLGSALVGVLPTYRQAGLAAPALLVALRLVQGFAVGGEQGGASVLTVEIAGAGRRGLWGSVVNSGSSLGLLLSSGGFALTQALLDRHAFLVWGWRVLFLAGLVLIAVGLVIRSTVPEPPLYRAAERTARPLRTVVRHHRAALLQAVGMRISQTAASYFYTVFVLYYLTLRRVPGAATVGVLAVSVSAALSLLTTPAWGALSDRVGRRPVFLFGALGSALYIAPFFLLVEARSPAVIVLGVVVGVNVFHDAMFGPLAAWFSELFRTDVRFSGAALGYQAGAVLGGGLLPLLAASLCLAAGGQPWLVCGYFLVLSALTVTAAVRAPETLGQSLEDPRAPAGSPLQAADVTAGALT
ncbi:MFS transporter [Streptomyces sp. RB6PN25]|uniref:MFS transporter n=1 Tax=Streptomyces humicola TaxID=2953240 RepID=A0ABT1PST5_9ACTN|nr:MFS transporter [Streptomyces humicola]MCQ4079627.1 MFS transporter [Streptomyces humicola]